MVDQHGPLAGSSSFNPKEMTNIRRKQEFLEQKTMRETLGETETCVCVYVCVGSEELG